MGAVHPRTCGEQTALIAAAKADIGSSPHVRGTVSLILWRLTIDRFIPARAGNRLSAGWDVKYVPVHPRTCGEQVGTGIWR